LFFKALKCYESAFFPQFAGRTKRFVRLSLCEGRTLSLFKGVDARRSACLPEV
jgi:hypothetical protein